jgi:uncharacterized membrane protein
MVFCQKCGAELQTGIKFCPVCGTPIDQMQQTQANDAEQNKMMAILSYIIFFIPLITGDHKKSSFVKFHVNQGTLLAIVAIAYSIIRGLLSAIIKVPVTLYGYNTGVYYTPGWLATILWLIGIPIMAACVYGIYNAATGKQIELPIIGKYRLIK